MTTNWEYGRLAKTPGVTPTFTFKSAHISTRMRRAAQKMIRERVLRGSWSSKARRLAVTLMKARGIPYYDTVNMFRMIDMPSTHRDEIAALVNADCAAKLLEGTIQPAAVEALRNDRLKVLSRQHPEPRGYISFFDDAFRRRALEVVARALRSEAHNSYLADRLAAWPTHSTTPSFL